MSKKFHYGGQAVIEGVMMRGQKSTATAVRRPGGELTVMTKPLAALYTGRWREIPFLRGIIVLIEALVLGIQTLLYSANESLGEEEEIPTGLLWGTVALTMVFAVALFFVAPLLFTRYLLDPYIASSIVSNLIEGLLRIGIFILYLKLIGLMPDIRRVFAYHGAEHKVVNAYEDGAPMEVEAVRTYHTAHARCGTNFLLWVLVIAIIVFTILGHPPMWLSILSRVILLPLIAALGYEAIRFGAGHTKNTIVRVLLAPGLALQAMTTREPDDSQLEVAISALKGVMETDLPEDDASEAQG